MRKKRHAAHANHERWLVSYADFITLLFAFFVVMFSSSQVDKRKVGQIALAVQVAFQQMGIFNSSNTQASLSTSEPMPFSKVQMVENAVRTEDLGRIVSVPKGAPAPLPGAVNPNKIQQDLEKVLAPELKRQEVGIKTTHDGLVISLREIGFFDSGSATLKPEAEPAVAKIAVILQERTEFIRIEGNTDDIPIHNGLFRSNWDLAAARATELVDLFISRYGITPSRLSVAGYAEFHPVAPNDTADGRAKNRRVDIVVLDQRTSPVNPTDEQELAPVSIPSALPAKPFVLQPPSLPVPK